MSQYAYVAVDPQGKESRGNLEVDDPIEAVRRIKEMGLFPTRVFMSDRSRLRKAKGHGSAFAHPLRLAIQMPGFRHRIKAAHLSTFTRQLATLTEAGMPLLRGLRILQEQEESAGLRRIISELALTIEQGGSLTEAVSSHPKVFNRLYVSMVKAGEIGGAMDVTLARLAEFIEKAQRIKARVKSAMFYPCAVLSVAGAITGLLMAYVVPRFKEVFPGLMDGRPLPAFTQLVFNLSDAVVRNLWLAPIAVAGAIVAWTLLLKTTWGRLCLDWLKLKSPIVGALFGKASISRFARTLGTLVGNGVPILQALKIVEETAGNLHVGRVIAQVRENVKQGDPIAPTLKSSPLFPAIVTGMVDVGEQTGALPEMLLKIADNYDEEVNNATNALTSLLEPVMIVFLAVVVGAIVIAMFLPLVNVATGFDSPAPSARGE
jgi:type IV pilus assembly protein PilC